MLNAARSPIGVASSIAGSAVTIAAGASAFTEPPGIADCGNRARPSAS